MHKVKSLKYNFLMNSILTISSIIFPLVTLPYVTRILLPLGTGKVSLATSVVSYFSLIAQLGIPTYGIRVCAKLRNNKKELSCNIQELLIINLVMCLFTYAIFFIMIFNIERFSSEKLLYIMMGGTILLNSIGIEWLYKGLEQYTYITIRSIIFKFIALGALFVFVHQQGDYIAYGAISVLAACASNILNFINARKYIFVKPYRKLNYKPHIKAVIVFFAMACATTIYTHLDNVMLGFIKTDMDVGYYNVAVKIKQFLVSIITSLGAVLLPRSSYYIETNQFEKFKEVSIIAINFIIILATPFMVYFTIFAKQSIFFLSGEAYENAIIPMQIMMPTLLFIGLSNLLGIQMLVPLGKEKHILYSQILGAVTNLVLNFLLIPRYASIGAAIGTLVAETVVLIYQYFILKDIVKTAFTKISYWKIGISVLLAIFLSTLVLKANLNYLFTLLISAILFFSVYMLTLLIMKETFIIKILEKCWKKK